MKVVLYARVSSERQAEKDLSIAAQLKALREYTERNGHVVVREFVDEAETGRSISKRPAFREMVALASVVSQRQLYKRPPFGQERGTLSRYYGDTTLVSCHT